MKRLVDGYTFTSVPAATATVGTPSGTPARLPHAPHREARSGQVVRTERTTHVRASRFSNKADATGRAPALATPSATSRSVETTTTGRPGGSARTS